MAMRRLAEHFEDLCHRPVLAETVARDLHNVPCIGSD
jgi:hypothetical protein